MPHKITAMWAVIATDADGTEGIVSQVIPGLGAAPLIAGHAKNLPAIRALAAAVKVLSPHSMKLVKFTVRKDVRDI